MWITLDTFAGTSCDLESFPEVKENGKIENNDEVQEGSYGSAVKHLVYQRAQSSHFRGCKHILHFEPRQASSGAFECIKS